MSDNELKARLNKMSDEEIRLLLIEVFKK